MKNPYVNVSQGNKNASEIMATSEAFVGYKIGRLLLDKFLS